MSHSFIQVIGATWMPPVTGATEYTVDSYALAYMFDIARECYTYDEGEEPYIDREVVEQWLTTHSGDFQSVEDFRAVIDGVDFGWEHEESEWTYYDCMGE